MLSWCLLYRNSCIGCISQHFCHGPCQANYSLCHHADGHLQMGCVYKACETLQGLLIWASVNTSDKAAQQRLCTAVKLLSAACTPTWAWGMMLPTQWMMLSLLTTPDKADQLGMRAYSLLHMLLVTICDITDTQVGCFGLPLGAAPCVST